MRTMNLQVMQYYSIDWCDDEGCGFDGRNQCTMYFPEHRTDSQTSIFGVT